MKTFSKRIAPFLEKAKEEQEKGQTLRDIQKSTALLWGARACVAANSGKSADAVEYAHEAIEHAALSGDDRLLDELRNLLAACGVL